MLKIVFAACKLFGFRVSTLQAVPIHNKYLNVVQVSFSR